MSMMHANDGCCCHSVVDCCLFCFHLSICCWCWLFVAFIVHVLLLFMARFHLRVQVMMQCASHHICITLSGWLLFVIRCCMLLYVVVVLLHVVVVVCLWCCFSILLMMDFDDDCCRFQLPCILSQIVTNYILLICLFLLSWQIFRYNTRS